MISKLSRTFNVAHFAKNSSFLSLNGTKNVPIYQFSESMNEYGKMVQGVDEASVQFGKSKFRQLYFPIKRIYFENSAGFQKIYQNPLNSTKNITKQSRLMRFFYHIPFAAYYLNYLFFLPPNQIIHQIAIASLFVAANAKSFNDSITKSREIAELYINNDAQKFIAVIPKFIISSNYNELQGKLKGSMFEHAQCQGFQFTLDDIDQITLLSSDKEKIKSEVSEKIGQKKTGSTDQAAKQPNQAEQKKQILEKLSKIQENEEGLILTISKDSWNQSRTFRLSLKDNELSHFNDYLIAMGFKQRIVMRESMAANNSSSAKQKATETEAEEHTQTQQKDTTEKASQNTQEPLQNEAKNSSQATTQ